MAKVKFKEYQRKIDNGFIENVTIAYIDITHEAKNIFGNIVKKANQIVSEYNEMYGSLNGWKEECRSIQNNSTKDYIEVDNEHYVIVEFTNGNVVEFFSSEWGHITKNDRNIF
jgi:hypothetical protein